MGVNLSTPFEPDLSGVTWSPEDRHACAVLAVIWSIVLYMCAMIFSTCTLIDRWRGPLDKNDTTLGNVLAALLCSAAWPAVLAYCFLN
ncbi:hypothetical protein NLU13_2611 [Sarocladium strictum]|uniref:Uncharacterized protein n=1 Tax=Sarocladium strictum TaxID=5046 RepID=A0AA39GKG8_SARSR|nr:hypothetical protein NLU13_2611 [Sarocladium strictum]